MVSAEVIRKATKPNFAVLALLFTIGIGTTIRFAPGVRGLTVAGISGGERHAAPRSSPPSSRWWRRIKWSDGGGARVSRRR
jgi:hypothetical protein